MTVRKLQPVPKVDKREAVLAKFADALEIGPIEKIVQRGRDPLTAPYTIHMADDHGTTVRVGTIKTLRSQIALGDVLAVTLGKMPPAIEKGFWHELVSGVVNHGVQIIEVQGETYTDQVREWLLRYSEIATGDVNGAAALERPFTETDRYGVVQLSVHVGHLVKDLDGRHSIKAKPDDLYIPLADIGFSRRHVNYTHAGKSSTRSYWTAPVDVLKPMDQ